MPKGKISAIYNETITIYPKYGNGFSHFEGTGLVKRISRGNEFDIVYVAFGVMTNEIRPVIVIENQARRQILTLKCGQYAHFYGSCVKRKIQMTFNGKSKEVYRWELYAAMCQGYYVPKMFDIRKNAKDIISGEVEDETTPMSDNEINAFNSQVEEILTKGMRNIRSYSNEDLEEENEDD